MRSQNMPNVVLLLALFTVSAEGPEKSPDQYLPPHISRLTLFGERADFSRDGRKSPMRMAYRG
jgi:hypothetical protein